MYKRLLAFHIAACMFLALTVQPVWAEALKSAPMTAGNTRNGMVRVRLSSLGNPSTLNLTVYGSYTVNGQSSRTLGGGQAVTVKFDSATGRLRLTAGGATSDMGSSFRLCRHASDGTNGVKIAQGRVPSNLYPGDFEFISRSSGSGFALYVIAHIYMEDYLYGVVPYEMGDASPAEALKAQAVAARTYTMRAMNGASSSSLYDVVDTTADQVYSGTPSGSASCKSAVDATKGIVLKNGGAFTATYYTASNGGQTESIKNAWGTSGYPYLGVKDDPYDLANPDSRKASFSVKATGSQSSALGKLLNQKAARQFGAGAAVTGVNGVRAHTPKYAAPSRLYTKLDFDVAYSLNGMTGYGTLTFDIFSELEAALGMNITTGSNELWSVTQTADGFTVTARRYGHGIGMSQRGAMYMAQMGYTYDQILAFYFEGCNRVEYTLTRSILSPVVPGQDSWEEVIPEQPVSLDTPAPDTVSARVATQSGSLNLRAAASDSAKVLLTIPQGAVIPVYDRGTVWCQTAYGGQTGYVMTRFLAFGDQEPAPAETPAPGSALTTARVTTAQGSLNLRFSPQSTAKVLRTIPQGTLLPIYERRGDWCKTAYGGDTGYVMARFLTFQGEAVPDAPTPAPQPAATSGETARVATPSGSLNLRASARDTAQVLRTIPQGDMVAVLQRGSDWCQVVYSGTTGYVMTRYLSFDASDTARTVDDLRQLPYAIVGRIMPTASTLNLREACSTQAKVLTEMSKYDSLLITAVGDTWCAVVYEGMTGYCMTKYLEFDLYE